MLESQNTTYGFPTIARFCKPQRERGLQPLPWPLLVLGPFATESTPLPQRLRVLEFSPVNFTDNYIFHSFENIPRMAEIQMFFFPLFTTFSPSAWGLEAVGTTERGFGGEILWACHAPLLGQKIRVVVAASGSS